MIYKPDNLKSILNSKGKNEALKQCEYLETFLNFECEKNIDLLKSKIEISNKNFKDLFEEMVKDKFKETEGSVVIDFNEFLEENKQLLFDTKIDINREINLIGKSIFRDLRICYDYFYQLINATEILSEKQSKLGYDVGGKVRKNLEKDCKNNVDLDGLKKCLDAMKNVPISTSQNDVIFLLDYLQSYDNHIKHISNKYFATKLSVDVKLMSFKMSYYVDQYEFINRNKDVAIMPQLELIYILEELLTWTKRYYIMINIELQKILNN